MHDLTGFQRDILYVLADLETPNGLTVKEQLEEDYGEEIHHGRVYPNLDELADMGLVEKGNIDRRTNYYELTSRGRRELEAHYEWAGRYIDND